MIAAKTNQCLLVKTASEIALKSVFVRRFFTKKLVQSIRFALKRNKIACKEIIRGGGRLFVFCPDCKKAQRVLSTVSGIHATAIALYFQGAEYSEIEKQTVAFAEKLLKKGDTFALDVNVANNRAFSGGDLERRLGAMVQQKIKGLKVKLENPEKEICIEIREKDFFIYREQVLGLGGLPLGAEGNVALLFSGKKDDLLAGFLMLRRGCNVFPVVKKANASMRKAVAKLVPLNGYREFILTEEKEMQKLIAERKIQAIVAADSKTDAKSLSAYKQFDARQQLVVLRPLLLYPREFGEKADKLFH
jgi:thiamine biosynthesis protein ThiI